MLNRVGYPSLEQIKSCFPKEELLHRAKAIIECFQEIPCNPCETSCPHQAITIGEDINTPPKLNVDLCTGCGRCVYSCPGLAIKVVKLMDDTVRFTIPYEFLPVPQEKETWLAVNHQGEVIGEALIEKVQISSRQDRTFLVHVLVDKKHLYDFAGIRRRDER